MGTAKPTTYWDYIRVEELLSLQRGLSADEAELTNDEVLFITVHQVFELWFKLILRELRAARDLFRAPKVEEQELAGAVASVHRVTTILRRACDHFTVMETLSTREYLAFRDKLMPASGFQSAQLREVEIVFGLEAGDRIGYGLDLDYLEALRAADGSPSPALQRVQRALADGPTLKEALDDWLYRTPIDGVGPDAPEAAARLDEFLSTYLEAHSSAVDRTLERALLLADKEHDRAKLRERYAREKDSVAEFFAPGEDEAGRKRRRVRAAMLFIETYRDLPLLAWPREVLDGLVELEQLFVMFRQRHARMVERVIGKRTGTGGSAGVDYLDETALRYRILRDLWAIRTLQVPADLAPPLRNPAFYGFASA
ncbi:MAG: tryptophan 2,3-dioxygenase [Planctomycetes bacterium]|nr:tryptophan 2,3-dioxygenase [Planctomycetota bacterium]